MRWRAAATLLLCAPALFAQQSDERAYLDLYVNEQQHETVLVRLRGGDALIALEDLETAGLHGLSGTREVQEGRELVSLKSLEPVVRFELDQQALAVRLVAPPAMLQKTRVDLTPLQRPRDLVLHKDTTGFFNYSVTGDTTGAFSGSAELGASVQGNLAFTGLNLLPNGRAVRGLSFYAIDDLPELLRMTLGDAVAQSSALGGAMVVAGASVTREFSLDPYFVRQPLPRLSGSILTPSTLDVYVNGALLRQEQLAPGQFEVRNLPVPGGSGQVSYVVRDAFGRTQEFASPYYAASGVLAAGLSEYGYQVGLRRTNFGTGSFDYDGPALLARHRIGIGDWLTAGYRFESALPANGALLASGGPAVSLALPVGELDVESALSTEGHTSGAAVALAYSVFTRRFSAGASLRAMTARYANVAQPAAADRPLLQLLGSAGAPLTHTLSLTLESQLSSMRDAGLSTSLALRADLRLTNDLSLAVSGSRMRAPGSSADFGVFATLLYNFGRGTSGDFGANAGQKSGASAGVQKSLPAGEGYAYAVRSTLQDGQSAVTVAQGQYQGAYGSYLATWSRSGSSQGASATVAGATVLIDDQLMASRPVQDGYALIQVPGLPGVRGYLNNQEIGRTDESGNLLVPSLQPYSANHLSIGDSDIPLSYEIGLTHQLVATPLRGGALVRFDVRKVSTVTGMVRVEGAVPAYGEMVIDARTSPLGGKGEFWFEGLTAGHHEAQVEFKDGTCRLQFEVPAGAPAALDLGTLSCTRSVAATP